MRVKLENTNVVFLGRERKKRERGKGMVVCGMKRGEREIEREGIVPSIVRREESRDTESREVAESGGNVDARRVGEELGTRCG